MPGAIGATTDGRAAAPLGEQLVAGVAGRWRAHVTVTEAGTAAGTGLVTGAGIRALVRDGQRVAPGDALVEIAGSGADLVRAEDAVLGDLGVACGVATNATRLRARAPAGLRVVCGGWKKLPAAMKPAVRAGLAAAGVGPRLVDGDFVYVGKNEVRLLDGVAAAVTAAVALDHGGVAVQVRSVPDAVAAVEAGAAVVMVDTGDVSSLHDVHRALVARGRRADVQLAFGGGAKESDLELVVAAGGDIVDVGRAILGSPLLDLRLDVVGRDA